MEFYITFGQDHPLRHHYVIARGDTYYRAREGVFQVLGDKWCSMLNEPPLPKHCPMGPVGQPIEAEEILDPPTLESPQCILDCAALGSTGFNPEPIATILGDTKKVD